VRWRPAGGGSRSHPWRRPGKKLAMSLDIDLIKGRVTQKLAERSDDTKSRGRCVAPHETTWRTDGEMGEKERE
jgi:hypothetical protein